MTHTRKNAGTCSSSTTVDLDEKGLIRNISVEYGCDGNLKGICALLVGQRATDAIERLAPVRCDAKATSCPHQIALCLAEALEKQKDAQAG